MPGSFTKLKSITPIAVISGIIITIVLGGAYAIRGTFLKEKAREAQDIAIASQVKLLHEYTEYNNAQESKYGVNDVVAGNEGRLVLDAYKTNGKHAKKVLVDNSYVAHIGQLTMKELDSYISETLKDSNAKMDAVKSLRTVESSIVGSHRLRLIKDAQAKLKASVDNANAMLNESNGKVDDNTLLQKLREAMSAASKLLHDSDAKTLHANAADVDGKIQVVKDAVQDHNARLAREDAARQEDYQEAAAASTARQAAIQSNSRKASHGNSRYSGSNGNNSRRSTGNSGYYSHAGSSAGVSYSNGFSIGGSCSVDSATDHCQGAVNGAGHNSLTHLTDDSGTNIYAIHSNYGGSSTWSQNSITINGQTHSLGAPFRANVTPMDGKQYFQTCGPDGKVYLRPMD